MRTTQETPSWTTRAYDSSATDDDGNAGPSLLQVLCVLLFLSFIVSAVWTRSRPTPVADIASLQPARDEVIDTCADKARCLVAVVAPWCRACTKAQPALALLPSLTADLPDVGVRVVVSGASQAELRRYAHDLPIASVYIDNDDGSFTHSLRNTSYPSFFVLDADGRVLRRTVGAPNNAGDPATVTRWLHAELGVTAL